MNLSDQLHYYRVQHHISQETLAQHLNVTRQTISKWETGKSLPDVEMLIMISNFLDVPFTNFVDIEIDVNSVKKKKRKQRIRKIMIACVTLLASCFLLTSGYIYHTYYQDPEKEFILYGIDTIGSDGEEFTAIDKDKNVIAFHSYRQVVYYAMTHHEETHKENEPRHQMPVTKKGIEEFLNQRK